jgi:hypothetical protein
MRKEEARRGPNIGNEVDGGSHRETNGMLDRVVTVQTRLRKKKLVVLQGIETVAGVEGALPERRAVQQPHRCPEEEEVLVVL